MSATALLGKNAKPTRDEVKQRAGRQPVPLRYASAHSRRGSACSGDEMNPGRRDFHEGGRRGGRWLLVGWQRRMRSNFPANARRQHRAARLPSTRSMRSSPSMLSGRVTVYSGKVDLGQGLRVAIPQMVAEELGCGVEQVAWVEGRYGAHARPGSDVRQHRHHARWRPDPAGGGDGARSIARPCGGAP